MAAPEPGPHPGGEPPPGAGDDAALRPVVIGVSIVTIGIAAVMFVFGRSTAPTGDAFAGVTGSDKADAARAALIVAMPYRTAVSEVYVSRGRWPASLAEVGVPAIDPTVSGPVRALAVRDGGEIVLELREPFAAGSRFVLTPRTSADLRIQWACRGEGDPAAVSGCEP